ncbi:hypothetical protein [Sphingobacterium sp. DR205]|uniref:hypothetical protein n=1 Tax=Sphingobacterium sp. DR205 TaxID=2713573 RepID=UPI0019D026EE|nr:hypothetical protein [Sphingobacterium sp. DR205]
MADNKYQGQELQETDFYSFKWSNYMPDVGRFFNIDPLAESFPYNSTYAFSENRVIDGIELEGLEWVPWVVKVAPLMENAAVRPNPVVETVVKTSETISKTTQEHHLIEEGRHANHTKLNEQIKDLLNEIPKSEALKGLRNLRDKTKDAINNNPDTKLNDLKLKKAFPVKNKTILMLLITLHLL